MPYVVIKKNGKGVNMPFVFTQSDVDNLQRNANGDCFTLVNTTTRRLSKVGACRKRKKGLGRSRRRR